MKNKEIDYIGRWYLPENPEFTCFGQLLVNDNIQHLRIFGSFQTDILDRLKNGSTGGLNDLFPKYHTIIGECDGKIITLFNCIFRSGSPYQLFGLGSDYGETTIHISPDQILIGDLGYENKEEVKFSKVSCKFVLLNQFIGYTKFSAEYKEVVEKEEVIRKMNNFEFDITKRLIKAYECKEYIFRINSTYNHKHGFRNHPDYNSIDLEEHISISIYKKSDLMSFNESFRIMIQIRNFLSLALRKPIYPLDFNGYPYRNANEEVKKIDIYLNNRSYDQIHELKNYGYLFNLQDIEEGFGSILEKWIVNYDQYKTLYDNFFSVVYRKHRFGENKFMQFITAIEFYLTKNNYGDKLIENRKEKYEKDFKSVINKIDELDVTNKYKKYLKRSANDFIDLVSLEIRINELLKENKNLYDKYINTKVIQKVVKLRNDISHGNILDPNDVSKILYEEGVLLKLEKVCEILILKTLNFEMDKIMELINRY